MRSVIRGDSHDAHFGFPHKPVHTINILSTTLLHYSIELQFATHFVTNLIPITYRYIKKNFNSGNQTQTSSCREEISQNLYPHYFSCFIGMECHSLPLLDWRHCLDNVDSPCRSIIDEYGFGRRDVDRLFGQVNKVVWFRNHHDTRSPKFFLDRYWKMRKRRTQNQSINLSTY